MSSIPGETHAVRRLVPDEAETTVAEQLAGLDYQALAHDDRPYLALNFATTLDGRAAIDGKSGPIGSATDTEVLQRLRTRVDAVMIGAGTMRAERYGRIVSDPDLRAYREQTGLAAGPAGRDRHQPARPALGRRPLQRRRRDGSWSSRPRTRSLPRRRRR